jgi:hypothetical protein
MTLAAPELAFLRMVALWWLSAQPSSRREKGNRTGKSFQIETRRKQLVSMGGNWKSFEIA